MELKDYQDYVYNKTAPQSKSFEAFTESLEELHLNNEAPVNVPLLITAAVGLPAEAGEFTEIVKKIVFQGKPLNNDNRYHMKRELGDLAFYLAMACSATGYTLQEIIDENVKKLDGRYKEGFTVDESENRKKGDL